MSYTLRSNATMAAATLVFYGDQGLVNMVGGAAITATGTIASSTVAGHTVWGDGSTVSGDCLTSGTIGAIASGSGKFAICQVGHYGLTANQTTVSATSPGTGYLGTAGGPVLNGNYPGLGLVSSSTFPSYTFPDSALHTSIYGRESASLIRHVYDGTGSNAYSGAFAGDANFSSGAWKFGGKPASGATGGFGVAVFAIFVGVSPNELATYIAGYSSVFEAFFVQEGATAPGATLTAAASLIAGSASGNSSGTAPGATLTAAASLIAGSASGVVNGTLNFQAAGMEFGSRTGLGIGTFSLDAGVNYRYTVHADALVLGAALVTSSVVATDSAGKLPNLVSSSVTPGQTYRVVAVRQSDGEAATFRMGAT